MHLNLLISNWGTHVILFRQSHNLLFWPKPPHPSGITSWCKAYYNQYQAIASHFPSVSMLNPWWIMKTLINIWVWVWFHTLFSCCCYCLGTQNVTRKILKKSGLRLWKYQGNKSTISRFSKEKVRVGLIYTFPYFKMNYF